MKSIIIVCGEKDVVLNVPEGETIAEAALREGMNFLGSCGGKNICSGCMCKVRSGVENLLRKSGEPHVAKLEGTTFVRTCQTQVQGSGAVIDATQKAKRW